MVLSVSEVLFKCIFAVGRHSSKKNEKRARMGQKGMYIAASHAAKVSAEMMISRLNVEKLKQRIDEPIECDIHAQFIFYYPESVFYVKSGKRSKTLGDLSNVIELPQDILQKVGIIANDTQICSLDGSRREPVEGSGYFLEIILRKF